MLHLFQTPDLVNASASEDDKIRAMMVQSTQDYDQSKYVAVFFVYISYYMYHCLGIQMRLSWLYIDTEVMTSS